MTLTLKTANQSSCMILWPMMMHQHLSFVTKGAAVEEISSRWKFIGILNLSCDLGLDHDRAIQSFDQAIQLMMMCYQTKFSCKMISSSENILESHNLIIWSITVTLTLNTANQSFWKTIWLMRMHHHTKFGSKRFNDSEDIIWKNIHKHFAVLL